MCKPKIPKPKPPAPPAPTAPDDGAAVLENATENSAEDLRKKRGTRSLRIDRTVAAPSKSTGLNLPTA